MSTFLKILWSVRMVIVVKMVRVIGVVGVVGIGAVVQGALGGDGIQGGEVAGVVTAAGFVHTLHSRDVFNVFLTNLIQLINFSENFEPS